MIRIIGIRIKLTIIIITMIIIKRIEVIIIIITMMIMTI